MASQYRHTSHTTYSCLYHIVWITKYRKKVLSGDIGLRLREIIRQICNQDKIEIHKGSIWTRPCPHSAEYSTLPRGLTHSATSERRKLSKASNGIPHHETTLLGTTLLANRILLRDGRQRERNHGTRLHS